MGYCALLSLLQSRLDYHFYMHSASLISAERCECLTDLCKERGYCIVHSDWDVLWLRLTGGWEIESLPMITGIKDDVGLYFPTISYKFEKKIDTYVI